MCADHSSHGATDLADAVQELYCAGQTDYSIEPVVLVDPQGKPIGRIEDGDSVIFCCRRGEREIQLTEAFVDPELDYFPRVKFNHLPFVILTLYHEKFKELPVAFAPSKVADTLGETLSHFTLRQMHISESEKFSHVTFFFNGGNNQPFPGEKDIRIPSPKGIPFDQIPELSIGEVVDQLTQAIREGYDFIITNFANGDVIGHTQNKEAKIKCAEHLDINLKRVIEAASLARYTIMVTADHGNLEELFTPDGKPHVSHTDNPVPFLIISPGIDSSIQLPPGKLADIAPTILSILGISQPATMTGTNLISGNPLIRSKRLLLVILDGWGIGNDDESNPIYLAYTPVWDNLVKQYPYTLLDASGEAVGLKAGKAGNSEAGHMNIGAGRVVLQDDVRLDLAMQDGSFYTNDIFLQLIADVKQHHSRLHLISLLSERSSHGSVDYPLALLQMAKDHNLNDVYIHIIFDGRSTEPGSAPTLLAILEQKIDAIGIGKIVTGIGRGIALDRDGNYKKTKMAYDALVFGTGKNHCVNWK
jgi:2,3-bisphosphoglycerate-independent phosphoglycerate mutase